MNEIFSVGFPDTLVRFFICMLVNWGIVHFLYFKKSKRRDFYFTFVIISLAIFFLVYLMMGMDRGKATMGVGLGLFGIFSIMRYRTDSMPVREMTYLFVVVCLSVVHAMSDQIGVDDNGKMVGFDTHNNLLKTCTIYQEICAIQEAAGGDFDKPQDNRKEAQS